MLSARDQHCKSNNDVELEGDVHDRRDEQCRHVVCAIAKTKSRVEYISRRRLSSSFGDSKFGVKRTQPYQFLSHWLLE